MNWAAVSKVALRQIGSLALYLPSACAMIGLGSVGCHALYASRASMGHSMSMSSRTPGPDAPLSTVSAF